jgi:diguanylate cyclase (GGDEF)-like protein
MRCQMGPVRSPLYRAVTALAVVVAVQAGWLALGLPGGRALSDLLLVVVPVLGAAAATVTALQHRRRMRTCWTLFAVVAASWAAANAVEGWYEVVLLRPAPTPSPAVWFHGGALVVGVAAMVLSLLPALPTRAGAIRLVLDVVLSGGAVLFVVWSVLVGPMLGHHDTEPGQTVTWLYPALGVVASSVAFATMTRVGAPARRPCFLLGLVFAASALADMGRAYAHLTGGDGAGPLLDPMGTVAYGLLAVAALAARRLPHLETRVIPARWESLGPYLLLSLALAAALLAHAGGELSDGMLLASLGLSAILVVRQVLSVLDHHGLARTLEQRVAERTDALRASESRFRSIVTSISDAVVLVDGDGTIGYQSPAVTELLGYPAASLCGQPVSALFGAELVRAGRRVCPMRTSDGGTRHVDCTITDLLEHPDVQGMVLALRDVEAQVELEDQLRHQANHDGLTGLVNRARLHEALGALLAAGRRPSLLLLDLDEFKAVNDTAGHDLGDAVLRAVADRLQDSTRPGDIVSRLGGDEFAVVLNDDPRAHAAVAVADRVLHALRVPMDVQGRQVRCLGSIGVAATAEHTTSAALLRDADVAMYVAKARGKGRIELFTPAMRDTVVRRHRIEDLLRTAVEEERLVVHYQPVVDLQSGQFLGAEALLRLRDDDGELVSPLDFVPIAEETGVIVGIGAWVLGEACRQAARWQEIRPDGPPFEVAVNVSTRQLQDRGLPRAVAAALEVSDLPAGLLTLEITEGALAAADADVDATLGALRRLGVRLSIDDFGAGYSSLGRLRRLPVDELKIDRSFIGELGGIDDAPLVDAILALAARLGLSVVAEGIETVEQACRLRARSCARGQGYLYARPLPAAELLLTLARGTGAKLSV